MWVLARFGFAALVFLFRALWRRQGMDQSVIYRDTHRVTLAKHTTTGPRHDRQRIISKIYWGLALSTPLVFAPTCAEQSQCLRSAAHGSRRQFEQRLARLHAGPRAGASGAQVGIPFSPKQKPRRHHHAHLH